MTADVHENADGEVSHHLLEQSLIEMKEQLDRIEGMLAPTVKSTEQTKRNEFRKWSSSVATKIGVKLLRNLAREATPRNGNKSSVLTLLQQAYTPVGTLRDLIEICRTESGFKSIM